MVKVRLNFVSNSSSCSFVVSKAKMTTEQFLKAKHYLIYEESDKGELLDVTTTGWICYERENEYYFSTSLDNFCMLSLVIEMGISPKDIGRCYHSNSYEEEWTQQMEKEYGITIMRR